MGVCMGAEGSHLSERVDWSSKFRLFFTMSWVLGVFVDSWERLYRVVWRGFYTLLIVA